MSPKVLGIKIPKKKPTKKKSHRGDAVEERQKYVPYILPDSPLHGKDYGERPTDPTVGFSNTGGGERRTTDPADPMAPANDEDATTRPPLGFGNRIP